MFQHDMNTSMTIRKTPRLKCASPLPALKYCGFSRKVKFCPCQKLLPFAWLLEDRPPQEEQKLLVRSCSHTNYYADLSHSISVNKRLIDFWNLIRKSGRVGLLLLLDGLCKWSWGCSKPRDIILLVILSLGQTILKILKMNISNSASKTLLLRQHGKVHRCTGDWL